MTSTKLFMIIAGLVILSLGSCSMVGCTEVPNGQRGIVTNYGKIKGNARSEGLVWYNPMTEDVTLMNVQTRKYVGETEAYTRDVQAAEIKYTYTVSLDPDYATRVYRKVGENWVKALVPQIIESSIKNVVGQSEAVKDTINNRQLVQGKIISMIKTKLKPQGVLVDGFELTDISFSAAFEKAVERKQIAVENANTARNRTVEIEENAKQTMIRAKAEADAMAIKNNALAGSPKLVEYEAVQKWDGKLPNYMMGGSTPFIQMPNR